VRRTPHISLAVWTAVTILFILFGRFYEKATAVAILISTLTPRSSGTCWPCCVLSCYGRQGALAVPSLQSSGISGIARFFVAVLSGIAGCLYVWSNVQVILPTAALYVAAGICSGLGAQASASVAPKKWPTNCK